ncbi:MAG: ferrous iron transport protein B [Phycisphaerae bacterium]|jgi:ferrous iron transport protein B
MPQTAPIPVVQKPKVVALTGNPNTGKTTLFNALTGYRQHVGNYAGVTVEKRTGRVRADKASPPVELVDLPGAYSLAAHSEDEAIVLDVLLGRQDERATPDAIVVVVDASNLRRNLFFTTQLLELRRPMIVALNMVDVAESSGIRIDTRALADELGVPVVPVVATKQTGIESLRKAIFESLDGAPSSHCSVFPDCVCAELDGLFDTIANAIPAHAGQGAGGASRVEALQTLLSPGGYHELRLLRLCGRTMAAELANRRARIEAAGESIAEVEAQVRYAWIDGVIRRTVSQDERPRRSALDLADRVITHRVLGIVILIALMGACFQSIYAWAGPLMDAIDGGFASLGGLVSSWLPAGALRSLIVDGVIAGVGGVLVFLPQILILFLFIAIMEDCGYMARAAFLLDRWMGIFGLSGKSLIPLLSSFACAIPGIMATRTIENRRDRFVTILIAPLMSCSARLPVYVLLIGAFIPAKQLAGGLIGLQAVTLLAMYAIGIVAAILVTAVLKRTALPGRPESFLMELPSYRWPSARTVLYRMYERGKAFCVTAGTIIVAVTILIWALGYYPRPASIAGNHHTQRTAARATYDQTVETLAARYDPSLPADSLDTHPPIASILGQIEAAEQDLADTVATQELTEKNPEWQSRRQATDERIAQLVSGSGPAGEVALALFEAEQALADRLAEIDNSESTAYLHQSFLGRAGRRIEPLVKPLGWDWRIGTAVIASFPAREVVVATMGTIYNLGDEQSETSVGLRQKLHQVKAPDGKPVFNVAVALSIMVFFALCCQCAATLATIKRETHSWRWPLLTFVYMTSLAYVGALVTYQVFIRII